MGLSQSTKDAQLLTGRIAALNHFLFRSAGKFTTFPPDPDACISKLEIVHQTHYDTILSTDPQGSSGPKASLSCQSDLKDEQL